jgi:hypothetical protein
MYILLKRLRAKKNTKLKMPGPVGRFQKFIERKKNAIRFKINLETYFRIFFGKILRKIPSSGKILN